MVSSVIIWFFLTFFAAIAVVIFLWMFLWKKKSDVDRKAYREVLKDEDVMTFHNIDEFIEAGKEEN